MKFFISCHGKQLQIAYKLASELSELGHQGMTITLKRNLGKDIFNMDRLVQAIGGFDYVLAIISQDYMSDDWLQREINAFKFYETNMGEGNIIIPILFENCEIPDFLKTKKDDYFKIDGESFDSAITKIVGSITQKKQAFIVMNMSGENLELELAYRDGIIEALNQTGYAKIRIDDYKDGGKISPRILREIRKSDIIIADLTGERPNCYYEVGYAHALGKKVILSAKEGTKVHFDLQDHNFIFWKTNLELKDKLIKAINFNSKVV